jgi:hypothetical protein
MITVNVWTGTGTIGSGGNVGHGSMKCGSTYISWWPLSALSNWDALGQLMLGSSIVPGGPDSSRTDFLSEGNRLPKKYVFVDVFNEDAILQAWSHWQAIGTYNIRERNCCSCVVTLLVAGGLSRILPHYQRFFDALSFNYQPIVEPDELMRLCDALRLRLNPPPRSYTGDRCVQRHH